MIMQTAMIHILAIQLIVQFYDIIVMINMYTKYEIIIDILILFTWSTSNIIKIVIFNYVCEKICTKVIRV